MAANGIEIAGMRRSRRARLNLAVLVSAALLPAAAFPGLSIFIDGFEVCDASRWSSSTGLLDCTVNLQCPMQDDGEACIAGRVFDLETSAPRCATTVTAAECTASGQGGACALSIEAYDALAFFSDPSSTLPLPLEEHFVDGCGRFRLSGFAIPSGVYTAVVVDDATGTGDLHPPTTDFLLVSNASENEGFRSYALTRATDEAWTASAGSPFGGDTFSDLGLFAAIFFHGQGPVAGFQITLNGSTVPADDYYFADTEPFRRSLVNAAAGSTGANGTGLLVESSFGGHSGTGNEPVGCVWPAVLGVSAPGVVLVREMRAEVSGQPGVPCP